MSSGRTLLVSPRMMAEKPSRMPSTGMPETQARMVAAPITLLMPGAGPPPTRIASRLESVMWWLNLCDSLGERQVVAVYQQKPAPARKLVARAPAPSRADRAALGLCVSDQLLAVLARFEEVHASHIKKNGHGLTWVDTRVRVDLCD